jgi:hypothetical protein
MKFIITAQERHDAKYEVEADSPDEAKMKVHRGRGDYIEGTTEFVELNNNFLQWEAVAEEPAISIVEIAKKVRNMGRRMVIEILEDNGLGVLENETTVCLHNRLINAVDDGTATLPEE